MSTIHKGGAAQGLGAPAGSNRPAPGGPSADALNLLGMGAESGNCFACSNPGFGRSETNAGGGQGATAFSLTMKSFLG